MRWFIFITLVLANVSSGMPTGRSAPFAFTCLAQVGGVVPRGQARFIDDATNLAIPIADLTLQLRDNRACVEWRGQCYRLDYPDGILRSLMEFIQGDTFHSRERMQSVEAHAFPENDAHLAREILANINRPGVLPVGASAYVNADFHITYQAFLTKEHAVDVAGLPLRYHWRPASDGGAFVDDVEIFAFPTGPGPQMDAVTYFQTAAILRQFRTDQLEEFARLRKAL